MMSCTAKCQKSMNAPSKSYTSDYDLICSFCVCMASQPVMTERWALHEAIAFLGCGWWSVGTHSGFRRLLYGKCLTFFPLGLWKGCELSWLICFLTSAFGCLCLERFWRVTVSSRHLGAARALCSSTSEDCCIVWVCRCCVGMTNCSVHGLCSQPTC